MKNLQIPCYNPGMSRKKKYQERTTASFPAGTFIRIDSCLSELEDRTDFIRRSVERELSHRELTKIKRNRSNSKPE